ncbi:MAG: glycosyltransferase family 2 protein, partial [Gammaproteobacteria bacterium]
MQRFLIVDNDSDDGTLDLLLSEPDVHVFFTAERYSVGNYGLRWVNALLSSHAIGHWTLTVDLDELLVYPACEETSLGRLAASLERRGEEAVVAFMLDMYSDLAICDTTYLPGRPFLDACAYFDGDDYEWDPAHPLYRTVPLSGGPRRRLFWSADSPFGRPPFLPKVPLAKWRAGLAYTVSTHYLDGARLSGLTAALLHFKFFSDFVTRAAEEAQRGEHWQNAAEYAVYA